MAYLSRNLNIELLIATATAIPLGSTTPIVRMTSLSSAMRASIAMFALQRIELLRAEH